MSINVTELLQKIANQRKIFHSEADLQHALAWEIHLAHPLAHLRLELPVRAEQTMHVDIFVKESGKRMAIELKYKTKSTITKFGDEEYQLRSHGAQNIGCYDFVKDIYRLETMLSCGSIDEGFAVMLTNDEAYRNNSGRQGTNALAFRIHHGRELKGELSWSERTGIGTKKGREGNIQLRNTYRLGWQQFSTIDLPKQSFHFLVVHVAS